MPTTTDLIGLAIDKNPVDFADQFNQIVMQKAQEAIENKRIELAQSIYSDDTDDDVGEAEFADNEEDTDIDDLDLDDIDLDDLDLEDIPDDENA